MDATQPQTLGSPGSRALVQRAQAILAGEVADGALANVIAADRSWAAARREIALPKMARQVADELGNLLDTLVDLVAWPPVSSTASPRSPAVAAGGGESSCRVREGRAGDGGA